MSEKVNQEIASFNERWKGGYFEGEPQNPLAISKYQQLGYMSVLHVTYLRCIKPYINRNSTALEIGPGRGAWTKCLLPAKEIYAMDALSADHNNFFEYLAYPKNVKYIQVSDFKCKALPENHFSFMFSYGCMCHISFKGVEEYATHTFSKMKAGANCFWHIADSDKYHNAVNNIDNLSIWNYAMPKRRRHILLKMVLQHFKNKEKKQFIAETNNFLLADKGKKATPGRWHYSGIKRTCSMLEKIGYEIIDPDVGANLRDPIIHFIKP